MKTAADCDPHRGFDSSLVKDSLHLTLKYNNAVTAAEKSLKFLTSTPLTKSNYKSIMNVSFTKCFEESSKGFSEMCGIVADNDSGYISNNQESNSVFAVESCSTSSVIKPIYLSEGALLEKPEVGKKEEVSETVEGAESTNLYSLSDSIVPSSFPSEKTAYSGLEESSLSSESFLIFTQSPVVAVKMFNSSCDTGMCTDISVENVCSQESKCDSIVFSNKSQTDNTTSECSINVPISNKLDMSESLVKTPSKIYKNPITSDVSPDLFSDEEPEHVEVNVNKKLLKSIADEKYVHRKDRRLINRVNAALSGVLPPPSFTVIHMTAEEILLKLEVHKHLFWTASDLQKRKEKGNATECSSVLERRMIDQTSLLVTGDKDSCIDRPWPEILEKRYHGLQ